MSIRVRHLRLLGTSRNYDVSFLRDSEILPLAVVAGEIATGKTSILEFIDFCLGGSSHPQHPEIHRQAHAALLEIELEDEILVIERSLFSSENFAWVHRSSVSDLGVPHARSRRPIEPASSDDSLSSFLLEALGLAGIELKEAPTKADSATQILSIRDLLWLAYLDDDRIGTGHLLFEGAWVKNLKLQQVLEVVFGVHDEQLAKLSGQLDQLRETRTRAEEALTALQIFLDEQEIAGPLELAEQERELREQEATARETLQRIEGDMRAATEFAGAQRDRYASARGAAGEAAAAVRYQHTLLSRLLPLRGQYAEDERKLQFYSEARTLFDPLQITVCPSCRHQCLLIDTCPGCGARTGKWETDARGAPYVLSRVPKPGHCGNAHKGRGRSGRSVRPCGYPLAEHGAVDLTSFPELLTRQAVLEQALEGRPPMVAGNEVTSLEYFRRARSLCALILFATEPEDLGHLPSEVVLAFMREVGNRESRRRERRALAEAGRDARAGPRSRYYRRVPPDAALMAAVAPVAVRILSASSQQGLTDLISPLVARAERRSTEHAKRLPIHFRFSPELRAAYDGNLGPQPTGCVSRSG